MNAKFPTPLRQKLLLTGGIGMACLLVGLSVFLLLKDSMMLLLSAAVCGMSMAKAFSFYRLMRAQAYEVVEGTCVSIAPKPLRKYWKVQIMDDNGNETTLLLTKQAKIQIGARYRFYFKHAQRLTVGSGYFASPLSADCFLGFEEVDADALPERRPS